jgi:translation initiation factor 1
MSQKKREGIVYSTDPDFIYQSHGQEIDTPAPAGQLLYIGRESKGRGGKTVSLIRGFTGRTDDLENLARELKTHCGTGGSVKDGEIIIQGDFRDKIIRYLEGKGYRTKRTGG